MPEMRGRDHRGAEGAPEIGARALQTVNERAAETPTHHLTGYVRGSGVKLSVRHRSKGGMLQVKQCPAAPILDCPRLQGSYLR